MNGKKRLSITVVILVPVFILGVLAIFFQHYGDQQPEKSQYDRGDDIR